MALVRAFEEAKAKQIRREGDGKEIVGGELCTEFFQPRETSDYPHAHLHEWEPNRRSRAHYHEKDQFQIFLGGKGTLGRHSIDGYAIHFARGFTPYGELYSLNDSGLDFFAMRAQQDPGSHRLPKDLDLLKQPPYHEPWQIVKPVMFRDSESSRSDVILQRVPDVEDGFGLAAFALTMKANATATAPDPSSGGGQYVALLEGSLMHEQKEHAAPTLVFIHRNEPAYRVQAGSVGLRAIIINFPKPDAVHRVHSKPGFKAWQCGLCAFVYSEAQGLPREGIAPGTLWNDVPESWTCPDVGCNSTKRNYQLVDASAL